jgi:integrase
MFRQSDLLTSKGDSSREKTLNETRSQVARFVSIMGDLSISIIGKRDIASFRDTLLQLPKSKEKTIRSKTIEQQISLVKSQGLPQISATTVTNALKQLSPVFTYAISIDLIGLNPTLGMKPKRTTKKVEVDNTDRGYSLDDINKVFQSDLFTAPRNKQTYGLACYWIPLICYYTGMRLNEVCQLNNSDINIDGPIAYINIRRGLNQSVKNDGSLRHVPIANHLIELGFMDYVKTKQGSLFPKLPQGTYNKPSYKFSTWWSKHIGSLNIIIRQPSHAFRHTFKTSMRVLGIEDSISDAITGHAPSNEGNRYGSVPLETKQAAINKLTRLGIFNIY